MTHTVSNVAAAYCTVWLAIWLLLRLRAFEYKCVRMYVCTYVSMQNLNVYTLRCSALLLNRVWCRLSLDIPISQNNAIPTP